MHERRDDLSVLHVRERTSGRYRPDIDQAFCYITTTGRRSGRLHTVEMWFAGESGRTIYALAGGREQADWVRNLMADPAVQVRIGDRDRSATARVVEAGTAEDALARHLVLDKYQAAGATDLETWARTALPVAFDLDP